MRISVSLLVVSLNTNTVDIAIEGYGNRVAQKYQGSGAGSRRPAHNNEKGETAMITYLYWIFVALLVGAAVFGIGIKGNRWKPAAAVSVVILLVGWSAYYFGLEQVFVKRYGGVMTISVPDGYYHIAATWKDDHLWVENYDPQTNSCIFSEYSKGNMLQGRVTIRNCNPLMRK